MYRRINLRDSDAPIKRLESKRRSPLFLSPPPAQGWGLGLRAQTKSIRLVLRTNTRVEMSEAIDNYTLIIYKYNLLLYKYILIVYSLSSMI